MNFFEIVGVIAVSLLAFGAACVVYHLLRAVVLAADFIMWQFHCTKQKDPTLKFSFKIFFRGIAKNWFDMIGYTEESFTCQIGTSEWKGFRSWKK